MDTENIKNEIEIDLRGLFGAILNRLTIIILVSILVAGIAFAYTQYFIDPQYVSTTKVYILSKQDTEENVLDTSDLAFATYLANDYRILLKSEPVLEEVKKELNLDQSISTLESMITVELAEEESRIMEISVTSTDPKLAKKIADKVRDLANEKTKNVMGGVEAVNAVDEANLPTLPASPNVEKNTMMGFIIGFALSVLVVVVSFILDDTIKTPDDIEKRLGVSVLASIPLKSANGSHLYEYGEENKKKKHNKRQKKVELDEEPSNDTETAKKEV